MKDELPIEVEEEIAGEALAWADTVKWNDAGQKGIALVAYTRGARMMYRKMKADSQAS